MTRRALILAALAAAACKPDLTSEDWLVTAPRVIAVKGEPPETKPGMTAEYTAFVAAPPGTSAAVTPTFSFCKAPKSPVENAVVSSACLGASSLVRIGAGDPMKATTPVDACTLFGPVAPPGGFRPRDADVTGGYYQPIRVDLADADPTFHLARVSCGVANASTDIAQQFATEYRANQNPHIAALAATIDGNEADAIAIPAGAKVELISSWDAKDAEKYAYFDTSTGTVRNEREAMHVAWYVDAGALETESTSRSADDAELTTTNVWTAPDKAGAARVWVVLRDSRGGVDVIVRDFVVSGR